jgi:uncharacterized membrane protein YdjX (TVP38/TMEM64 family)
MILFMTKNDEIRQSKSIFIITTILIAGLIGAYFAIPSYRSFLQEAFTILTSGNDGRISQWVQQFGFWGPFFIVFATVAQMFLLIINVVLLVLVAILAYGPFWGSFLAIFSICTASTVGYFMGRFLGIHTVGKLISEKSSIKVEEFIDQYGIAAVVIFRFSPFLSNDAISFVAGLLKMNYWKFMAATIAGITPLTALIAWMAEDMQRLKTGLIWGSAISIAGFIVYVIYDKYWRK